MFANAVRVVVEGRATWVPTCSLRNRLRIVLKKVELILSAQYVWRLSEDWNSFACCLLTLAQPYKQMTLAPNLALSHPSAPRIAFHPGTPVSDGCTNSS